MHPKPDAASAEPPAPKDPALDEAATEATEAAEATEVTEEGVARSDGSTWWVYVLSSADARRTYVGSTRDVERRLLQHNGALPGGARATRAGRPWRVGRVLGPYANRGEALRAELALKRRRGARRFEHS